MATHPRTRLGRLLAAPDTIVLVCVAAGQAGVFALSLALVDVARALGTSAATVGQLRTLAAVAGTAASIALIRVAPRVDLRALLGCGTVALVVGSLASAVAPGLAVLAAGQVVTGVAVAVLSAGGTAAAAAWSPPQRRTRTLSAALIGPPLSWVVGMPVAGVVAAWSWRLVFVAVPFTFALFALALLRGAPRGRPAPAAAGSVLRERRVALWACGELLAATAWSGTLFYSAALLIETHGLSAGSTSVALALAAASYVPGNLAARRLSEARTGRVLVPLALAAGLGVLLLGAVRPSALVSGALLCGTALVAGGRVLAGGVLGVRLVPERAVAALAVRNAALQIGYVAGALVGGVALACGGYELLGSIFAALFALSAGAAVAAGAPAREAGGALRPQASAAA